MQETRRTSRLLATKQPWPQCILLQNLGQRDYQKKAQDVNDLRRHLFELDNNRELMAQVFFSNRVVDIWNSLSKWVVTAKDTFNNFKRRLDTYWHNQEIICDFRAQLQGTGSRSEVSRYE